MKLRCYSQMFASIHEFIHSFIHKFKVLIFSSAGKSIHQSSKLLTYSLFVHVFKIRMHSFFIWLRMKYFVCIHFWVLMHSFVMSHHLLCPSYNKVFSEYDDVAPSFITAFIIGLNTKRSWAFDVHIIIWSKY